MKIHRKYMERCIQLGKNGLGATAPNPMVGSVVVHDEKIIGEGYTSPYGGPHAEVNAIASVENKTLLSKAVLYVTLEPCSHFGKTPPCVDFILKHNIPKVVLGISDPHDKVAGNGIKKLQAAGCEMILGIMEDECREHHKRFLTFHQKKRPYIILKWAETIDGFLAPEKERRKNNPEPFWITNKYSRQLVHQWRSEEQAILVGTNTVLDDNPKLDVRHWKGKNPIRVVLDKELKINADHHVMDGSIKTIVLTQVVDSKRYAEKVDYEVIDFSKNVALQIRTVLHKHQINSVMVEGGAKTLQTFIDADLWDEARIFTGSVSFGTGIPAPRISGRLMDSKTIVEDSLKIIRNG